MSNNIRTEDKSKQIYVQIAKPLIESLDLIYSDLKEKSLSEEELKIVSNYYWFFKRVILTDPELS